VVDRAADAEMDWVVRLISGVRSVRTEVNVPPATKLPLLLRGASLESLARLERHREVIERMARLESAAALAGTAPKGAVQLVLDEATLMLPLAGAIDIDAERARLARELQRTEQQIERRAQKLANPGFTDQAPEHIVEGERERLAEDESARQKLADALARLRAA
jgi:valyl-tRNA synthetase